jgi:predicted  nucleic acid-binding Zn-ribbon protein
MVKDKKPDDITLQRISYGNVLKIEKYGKPKFKESLNDALTRVFVEYEEMRKEIKKLRDELKNTTENIEDD